MRPAPPPPGRPSERGLGRKIGAAALVAAAITWALLAGYLRSQNGTDSWSPGVLTAILPSLGLLAAGALLGRSTASTEKSAPTDTTHIPTSERQHQ